MDVDTAAYDEGHVPGAVGWNWTTPARGPGPARHPDQGRAWRSCCAQAGVGNDTTIVLYGDNNNWFAAYAYWLLEMYGHKDVKLMNGGRKKWVDEGRALTTDVPQPSPRRSYTGEGARPEDSAPTARRCWSASARQRRGAGRRALARGVQRRGHGAARPAARRRQRGGHIPGAENIPWAQAVQRRRHVQVAPTSCETLYGGKGVTADKDVIAYCRIGERSSPHVVRAEGPAGLPQRPQLRRLVDRVGLPHRRADRRSRVFARQS